MSRRTLTALLLAVTVLVAGPMVLGPATPAVRAHAQLLSASPAPGQSVPEPPGELRLVFSERLEPAGTGVDVLDPDGRALVTGGGAPETGDPRTLVVPLPPLEEGLHTVQWRSLSADDGHAAQGTYAFAVGDVAAPGGLDAGLGDAGAIHAGHGPATTILETIARGAGTLGAMLPLGLLVIAWAVVRPVNARLVRSLANGAAWALVAGGLGAALLGLVAASHAGLAPVDYLTGSRTGVLIVARAIATVVIGLVALGAIRRDPTRGAALAGLGGAAAMVLLTLSGHAAGAGTAGALAAMIVHLAAAGTWLSGLLVLSWIAVRHRGDTTVDDPPVSAFVPRFSAVALVAVALFSGSGIALSWFQLGQLLDLATPYGAMLALKVGVVVAALLVGVINYLGRPRGDGRVGMGRRVRVEATMVVVVVGLTALLASGSPPGGSRPVAIARAASSAVVPADASLALQPARSGPVRILVETPASEGADGARPELVIQRVDVDQGLARPPLRRLAASGPSTWVADTVLPPGTSSWDATVLFRTSAGEEVGRDRFTFALDSAGLTQGGRTSPVDVPAVVALLLLGLALGAMTAVIAGFAPPRTEPRTGRAALVAGAAVAAPLAVILLVASGPV